LKGSSNGDLRVMCREILMAIGVHDMMLEDARIHWLVERPQKIRLG
jgi:hypothetical protein